MTGNIVRACAPFAAVSSRSRVALLHYAAYKRSSSLAVLVTAVGGLFAVQPAAAQTSPNSPDATPPATAQNPEGLQEIIVTAEKRSTNLQRTPISVTAVTGEAIRDRQIRDLRDVQTIVPNFKFGDAEGNADISIRGVGSSVFKPGAEAEVAVNENEVYVSRPVAQQTGLFDVSSLEVLRGPQGTLYGRNASAGAVNITTARPTDQLSGYFDATVGNYGQIRFEGAAGGGLDKDGKLLVRIAGFRDYHDGYGHNVITGTGVEDRNAYGVRATVVFKPTEKLQGTLIAEYYHQQDHSGQFHYFGPGGLQGVAGSTGLQPLFITAGGFAPANVRDIAYPFDLTFGLRTIALTGIVDWKSDGPFSVKLVSGYRHQRAPYTFSVDGGSTANVYEFSDEPAWQFSQEVQLHYDADRLHITAGGYYFHEEDTVSPQFFVASNFFVQYNFHFDPGAPLIRFLTQDAFLKTDAYAGFGQATYNLTSSFSLTAGIRYSTETKNDTNGFGVQFVPYPSNASKPPLVALPAATFSAWTPKFGAQYQLDPRTMLYASFTKGFKSGGFDVGTANPLPFQPEKLSSYEAGIKTTTPDRRVRANITGFYYDYSNLQVQQVIGLAIQTANAATARVYGLEGEFSFLLSDAFQIDASGSWTHARYRNYCGADPARTLIVTPPNCAVNGVVPPNTADFSGNALSNAPDWRANISAQYAYPVGPNHLIFRGELEYSSRFYFASNNFNFLSQSPYAKLDLSLTYKTNKNWLFRVYVKNLTDKTTKTSALVLSDVLGNPITGSLSPPRIFGGQVSFNF